MASLNRAIIHHTENTADYNITNITEGKARVRATQSYHKSLGWCDIGYHFLVDKYGNIYQGLRYAITDKPRGMHDGVNTNSFGFCAMGNFDSGVNTTTTALRNSLYDIVAWRMPNPFTGYGSGSYGGYTVGYIDGHRAVSPKTCPGQNIYNYIGTSYNSGTFRDEVNKRIVGGLTITRDNGTSYFSASSNWWTSSNVSGYYGTNYHVRGTASGVSDAATWTLGTITTAQAGDYKVYARWTSSSDRSASAPYVIQRGDTTTTVVNVNQRVNGGQWNLLGTMYFWQGTNRNIKLSCWTTNGYYVIADAVRITNQ